MATAQATEITEGDLIERGYKSSRSAVRSFFKDGVWATGNMPRQMRRELNVLGGQLVRCLDMLDLESTDGLPLDVCTEARDQLKDAFAGNPHTAEHAALAEVVSRHDISTQWMFDMIDGADRWVRYREFKTYEQLDAFATDVGASAMAAAVKIVGFEEPDWEEHAFDCGKAILLSHLLFKTVPDLQANRCFLAQDDLERYKLDVQQLKQGKEQAQLKQFVRFNVARLEKLYYSGGKLIPKLGFDGARTLTSLLCLHWRMLMRVKRDPNCLLEPESISSRRDLLSLKSRHLLGLEGGIPIIPEQDHHH